MDNLLDIYLQAGKQLGETDTSGKPNIPARLAAVLLICQVADQFQNDNQDIKLRNLGIDLLVKYL